MLCVSGKWSSSSSINFYQKYIEPFRDINLHARLCEEIKSDYGCLDAINVILEITNLEIGIGLSERKIFYLAKSIN